MKIQTFSVLVGSQACNARCPFCVSKMTPNHEDAKPRDVNWRNFHIACDLAVRAGATTAMITGKGEPTLWPELVHLHVMNLRGKFPLLELQTNGIAIASGKLSADMLKELYANGLTTVAVSVAHWDPKRNAEIYTPDELQFRNASPPRLVSGGKRHFEIPALVEQLHSIGFSVRLCAVLVNGWLEGWEPVREMIQRAKKWGVEQLTLTPINAPKKSDRPDIVKWVKQHQVQVSYIHEHLRNVGDTLMQLPHGAEVFDYEGQNVCLNNCLSVDPVQGDNAIRNLVFHPDGHLRSDWTHEGSIIL